MLRGVLFVMSLDIGILFVCYVLRYLQFFVSFVIRPAFQEHRLSRLEEPVPETLC
jgi:hypothetical protein